VLALHPLSVKARRGTTLRGTQTDPVDARLIADILRRAEVPTTQMPDAAGQGLRELTRLRSDLVAQSSDSKRWGITALDRGFAAFAPGFRDVCGLTAQALLAAWALRSRHRTCRPGGRLAPQRRAARR
jgi:transposase